MNQKVLYDLPDHYFTNGRDLHSLSGSKEDYITWFRSTFGNRYTEGKDYVQVIVSVPGPDGQPECLIDHRLLPYMAVYAVMMMPNEAGHIMRDTAIQIMAQWVNVDCVIAHASEIINIYSDKGDYSYATRILERCPSIRSCNSKLAYEEWIAKSNEPVLVRVSVPAGPVRDKYEEVMRYAAALGFQMDKIGRSVILSKLIKELI